MGNGVWRKIQTQDSNLCANPCEIDGEVFSDFRMKNYNFWKNRRHAMLENDCIKARYSLSNLIYMGS